MRCARDAENGVLNVVRGSVLIAPRYRSQSLRTNPIVLAARGPIEASVLSAPRLVLVPTEIGPMHEWPMRAMFARPSVVNVLIAVNVPKWAIVLIAVIGQRLATALAVEIVPR